MREIWVSLVAVRCLSTALLGVLIFNLKLSRVAAERETHMKKLMFAAAAIAAGVAVAERGDMFCAFGLIARRHFESVAFMQEVR